MKNLPAIRDFRNYGSMYPRINYTRIIIGVIVFLVSIFLLLLVSSVKVFALHAGCEYSTTNTGQMLPGTCVGLYGSDPWDSGCIRRPPEAYTLESCSSDIGYLETWLGVDCTGCSGGGSEKPLNGVVLLPDGATRWLADGVTDCSYDIGAGGRGGNVTSSVGSLSWVWDDTNRLWFYNISSAPAGAVTSTLDPPTECGYTCDYSFVWDSADWTEIPNSHSSGCSTTFDHDSTRGELIAHVLKPIPQPKPNLTVSTPVVIPPSPEVNQTHTVSVDISNDDKIDIGTSFNNQIFLDGSATPIAGQDILIDSISKNGTKTITFGLTTGLTIATAGSHKYKVCTDTGGAIDESSEADNCSAEVTFNVTAAPLTCTLSVTSPVAPNAQQNITATITGDPASFKWEATTGVYTANNLAEYKYDSVSKTQTVTWKAPNAYSTSGWVLLTPYRSINQADPGAFCTANINTTAPPPDFSISLTPLTQSVEKPSVAVYTITINPLNGWNTLSDNAVSITALRNCPSTRAADCQFTDTTVRVKTENLKSGTTYNNLFVTGKNVARNLSHDSNPVSLTILKPTGTINVTVWEDSQSENCNQNGGEDYLSGVGVWATGASSQNGTTNASGNIIFSNVLAGPYQITINKIGYTISSTQPCDSSNLIFDLQAGETKFVNWALVKVQDPAWFKVFDGDIHSNEAIQDYLPIDEYLIDKTAGWDESGGMCTAGGDVELGFGDIGSGNSWLVEDYNNTDINLPILEFKGSYDSLPNWNSLEAGKTYESGSLTINSTVNYRVDGEGIVLVKVDGDLAIENAIKNANPGTDESGIVFYVDGNVTIGKNAEQLDAIILTTTGKSITVKGKEVGDPEHRKDKQFLVNGSLYAGSFSLPRNRFNIDANIAPTEIVNFMPIYLVGSHPKELEQLKIYWAELD